MFFFREKKITWYNNNKYDFTKKEGVGFVLPLLEKDTEGISSRDWTADPFGILV